MAGRELLVLLAACANERVVADAELVFMAGPSPDLVVMNLDGTNREQLTHDPELEFLPHFAPDATRIVYTKFLQGSYGTPDARTDIAMYDFTTRAETLLTARGDAAQAVWSPDGATLAFLAHSADRGSELWLMDPDGTHPRLVMQTSEVIGDPAWSSDDWILLVVAEEPAGPCFKTRLDKLRPDGTGRTQVTDGGASCTPAGMEQSGDADPGFSADGRTIYTSRGLPRSPAGGSPPLTERKLLAFSSDPWSPGKPELDLSLPAQPDCIEGVPKGSPDGRHVLLFRACFDTPTRSGVYSTDTRGSIRTFIADGFGPDWNPTRNLAADRVSLGR